LLFETAINRLGEGGEVSNSSEAVEKVSEECPLLSGITSRIFNH